MPKLSDDMQSVGIWVGHLDLSVQWQESGRGTIPSARLTDARPSAQEMAALFLGLEEAYQLLAEAFGYPPHFLSVVAVNNPELKISLEGSREAIDALRELILALPRLVAGLFRPRLAWQLAGIEAEAQKSKLERKVAAARAEAAEAEVKRLSAELESVRLREEISAMPISSLPAGQALLAEIVNSIKNAAPEVRSAFVADTARYLAATRAYEPTGNFALAPHIIAGRTVASRPGAARTKRGD